MRNSEIDMLLCLNLTRLFAWAARAKTTHTGAPIAGKNFVSCDLFRLGF